jgi:hypothetical protein
MHHLPVLVAIAIAPQAAEKLPEAEALLTKVEAKLGSSQIRTAPAAIVMTGGMEIPGMARIPHEQLFVGVDRVKYSSNMGDFGTQTQGTTPEYAWSTDPATGITIKTGMDRLGVARGYAVERRAPWTSLYSAAKTLGVTDLDGRKHFELEMTPHDGGARWRRDLVAGALEDVRRDFENSGRSASFAAFQAYFLTEDEAVDYAAVGARLGLTHSEVSNALQAAKQAFRTKLRARVAETVSSVEDLEAELTWLFGRER